MPDALSGPPLTVEPAKVWNGTLRVGIGTYAIPLAVACNREPLRGSADSARPRTPPFGIFRFPKERELTLLDEDDQRFGQHAVVRHRLGRPLGFHRAHQSVHVGDVHQNSNPSPALRVDECTDVGDAGGPKDLCAIRGCKPMIRVLHIVVTDNCWHRSSSESWPTTASSP